MKILFIGLGAIGQRHLRNIINLNIKNLEIYAYRNKKLKGEISNSLSYSKNIDIEKKYNIKIIKTLKELQRFKPTAAYICTPSSHHIKYALILAKNNVHLFIEKPLSNNLLGVKTLKEICKKNKILCYVGFQLRFNPVIKKIKEILENKLIGDIVSVNSNICEYMPYFHKYEDYRKTYAAKKELGGGVILSQIHEIDYLQWLFGFPTTIYAVGGKRSDLKIDVEDSVTILMHIINNKVDIPITLYMDFLQKLPKRSLVIYGTKGRIEASLTTLDLKLILEDNKEKKFNWKKFERNKNFILQTKNFFDAIQYRKKIMVNLDEGIKSLQIALAIKDSIKLKKIIKLKKYV